jgi:hypothetical protein
MTLRAMLAEMGMSSIPSIFPVPRVQDAFAEDGTPTDAVWYGRSAQFLEELEWYARALKAAREQDAAGERIECEAQALVASAR